MIYVSLVLGILYLCGLPVGTALAICGIITGVLNLIGVIAKAMSD